MSDKPQIKVERCEPTPAKPAGKRRWLLFLSLLALTLVLLVVYLLTATTALDGVRRYFRYFGKDADYGRISLEHSGVCSYAAADRCFAVAGPENATLYAENGSILAQVDSRFSDPAIKSAAEFFLIYDIGGTRVLLLNSGGKLLLQTTVAGTIFDAEVSSDGFAAILYEGTDCRATLEVYDADGTLLYRRNSKSHYLNTCAISPDGGLAVATVIGQEDIRYQSMWQAFRTDSEEIYAALSPLGDRVIYDLALWDEEHACAVSDDAFVFFGPNGGKYAEYAADDGVLELFSLSGDGYATAIYDLFDTGSGYRLATLGADGEQIATTEFLAAPLSLSVCEDYIAVLTQTELLIYDRELTLRSRRENSGYLYALARPDGTAMCISPDEAELYIP